jgi:uncharacterized protein (TIGR02466 family)
MRHVYPLFSVGVVSYEFTDEIHQNQLLFLENICYNKNINNSTSEDFQILENEIFFNIKNFCLQSVNDYFQNILNKTHRLRIVSSWANKTNFQESHHLHYHKNSILSGVFYFKDTHLSPIIFYNPLISNEFWDCASSEYNEFNSEFTKVKVEANTCIVFPSWLKHSVDTNLAKDIRYSISFNTFFEKNIVVSNEKTLYLDL